MALGKAFIEVHADTRPFAQELGKELGRILKAIENGPARKAGEKLGKDLGAGASEGFEKSFKPNRPGSGSGADGLLGDGRETGAGFAERMLKGLIDTLDDGLSGLPKELKAGLAAFALVAAPVLLSIGAALASALLIGLTATLAAGLGVTLAAQLDGVQDRFRRTMVGLRDISQELSQPFVGPIFTALQNLEDRLDFMGPELQRFFELGARAVVPLASGIMDLFENALPYINSGLSNIDTFANVIANGFGRIGTAVGRAFDQIANNDDAVTALNDTLIFIEDIVTVVGMAIRDLLDLYGTIRKIGEALDVFELFDWSVSLDDGIRSTDGFAGALRGLFDSTEAETEALAELNKQLADYADLINDNWSANIDFEQSLDDLTKSLRENGRTTDINTEKGRDNQRAIQDSVMRLREQRDATIALTGDVEGANTTFEANRKRLEDAAVAGGITRDRYRELTDAILSVPGPITTGVTPQTVTNVQAAAAAAANLAAALWSASRASISVGNQGFAGFNRYAEGGIFNRPTVGMFGEAGEEVILPTTKPARTAELISQSPMLSSMMSPNVSVYIGNQQIDAYIDERVARSQTATARSLSYGSRSI